MELDGDLLKKEHSKKLTENTHTPATPRDLEHVLLKSQWGFMKKASTQHSERVFLLETGIVIKMRVGFS